MTSSIATLTVTQAPPVIVTQPLSQSVLIGSNAAFAVGVSGTGPFSYQWQFNGNLLAGSTNATLQITNAQLTSAGSYIVTIVNAAGSVTSGAATLTVLDVPRLLNQPQGQTVTAGTTVSLSVTAAGGLPLNYQWFKNGTNLAGQVFSTLPLGGVGTNASGTYWVVIVNSFGSVTSAPAILTVTPAVAPSITAQPQSQTVRAGSNVTFTVSATGTAPLGYQWVRNGVAVPGNDAPTFTVTNATLGDAGSYFVQVFNSAGLATSATVSLTVNAPPQFLSVPQPATVIQGATTNFSATASGTPGPAFAWFKDGVRLTNSAGYSGVSTTNLQVSSAQAGQMGSYVVVATNVAGAITSAPGTLTVLLAPVITTHPTNATLTRTNYTNAMPVTLRVAATGAAPLLYQWRFNGGDLAGETNTTFTLTNVTRLSNGVYQAVVTNVAGSAASSNALVRVRVTQRVEPPVLTPGTPFRLRFTDDNGEQPGTVDFARIEVQATTNLIGTNIVWVTLTNGFTVVNGLLQFDDPASTNLLRRYYRVIEK